MVCIRCGEAEIPTDSVFMVGFDREPDLVGAIDAALRSHGIEGMNGLGQLCERCWEVANAAIDAGGQSYWATRRDVLQQHWEANLGHPMTPVEREEMDAYFDGTIKKGGASSR
jgi:hypothetical protein